MGWQQDRQLSVASLSLQHIESIGHVAPRLIRASLHDADYQLLENGDVGQSEVAGRAWFGVAEGLAVPESAGLTRPPGLRWLRGLGPRARWAPPRRGRDGGAACASASHRHPPGGGRWARTCGLADCLARRHTPCDARRRLTAPAEGAGSKWPADAV